MGRPSLDGLRRSGQKLSGATFMFGSQGEAGVSRPSSATQRPQKSTLGHALTQHPHAGAIAESRAQGWPS
eukprot:1160198-Pelagomonas_calceolata.AAC.9